MQLHNRALGAAASGLLFLATMSASPAWAHHVGSYSKTDQKCRDSIAKMFAKAVKAAGTVSNTCHKLRDLGKEAAATDCNDLAQADSKGKFQKAQTKLSDIIDKLCIATGASTTVLAEFTSCPEPCGTETGVSNPIATYAELGQCLSCLSGDIVGRSNADMLGSPAGVPLDSVDAKCDLAIAKGYQKRLTTILKSRAKCQKDQDAAGNTTLAPCDTSDDKGKIAAALTKAEAGIDKSCASANLANLDSCANTNLSDLKACLLAENDAAGTEAFSSSYQLDATVCPVQINSQILTGWSAPGVQQSGTFLEIGWTGLAHDIDLADGYIVSSDLSCPNGSPPCGDCTVTGVSANGPQYATFTRCANDFSQRCTTPFQPDNVNCGGNDCVYVLGPPLPISAANNPTCTINALESNITGTVNPDAGSSQLDIRLLSKTHTGGTATLTHPCPVCVGDPVAGDGIQGGKCQGGARGGACDVGFTNTCLAGPNLGAACTRDADCGYPCDVDAYDATFGPQPDGEGLALDCPPSPGTNITGVGSHIPFNFTTGHTELDFSNACDSPLGFLQCPCGVCTLDTSLPCRDDAECASASAGTCTSKGGGVGRVPNGCSDVVAGCVPAGDDKGVCNDSADDLMFCDGVTRANGHGIVACASNGDCANSDCDDITPGLQSASCGNCTMSQPKPCFLDPIVDDGVPDTEFPSLVGTFCIPPTNNAAINGAAGNPGPARVRTDMVTQLVY